jgi:hypothetical protein
LSIERRGVRLDAGQQVWRIVMDSDGVNGAIGNINHLRVVSPAPAGSTPYQGVPPALPGILQVEHFDSGGPGVAYRDNSAGNEGGQLRATDVDIEPTADAGGGFNVGWIGAGEWLTYTVNVNAAGTYDIGVRVASQGSGGTFHIEVGGVDVTGPMVVPDTGGWQTWTTIIRPRVSLAAGTQVWRLVMDANGSTGAIGNINYIRVGGPSTFSDSAATER